MRNLLDISNIVLAAFLEQGLYAIEFHPDYANNGRFFVHFAEVLRNGDGMIVEYAVSDNNPNQANPDSARAILQIDQPWANHNGGELAFGPDGYLYIGMGDGGWEGDPLEAGQNLNTLLGKLLRIDVDNDDGRPYAIPDDNPFAASQSPRVVQLFGITEEEFSQIHTEARPEIWAYGLRNPWKFHFDSETGDLYLPDVGQNHWEEINFQPASSEGGENYGWDFLMGTHCFPIEAAACSAVGTLPVAEYSHDLGCSVTGMGIYRGDEFADLDGIYFSGDYCSGRIWALTHNGGDWRYAEVLDTNLQITGGGAGEDGAIYVTSCNCNYGGPVPAENPPGSLWRLVPADQVPEGTETAPVQ
ncbi:MAG: PQQ-dependent sugar dehydrogenase [Caldilineaceae bacterium]